MGYPIEECVWPESHVPEEVKTLLDLFFQLADTKADDSGRRMAEEVFTPEGIIQTSQRFQGSQQIAASREHAWDHVQERKHSIFQAYTRDLSGLELVLVGQVAMLLKNKKDLTTPMSIHVMIEKRLEGHRISFMQAFADSGPLKATINGGDK